MKKHLDLADTALMRAALNQAFGFTCQALGCATEADEGDHCPAHTTDPHCPDRARDLAYDQWLDAS